MKSHVTIRHPKLPKAEWALAVAPVPGWRTERGANYLRLVLGSVAIEIPRPWLYSAACQHYPELLSPLTVGLQSDVELTLHDVMKGTEPTAEGWLQLPFYLVPEHLRHLRGAALLVQTVAHYKKGGRL